MSNLPVLDESLFDTMFKDLEAMNVELDMDPLEFGPKRLNQKVAVTRDFLTQCEKLFTRVSHWLQLYKRAHRAAQLDFDLAMHDMLANDPEVRAGRNVADRNAIATTKMRDRREELDRLAVVVQDLEGVLVVIKSKRSDLKDTQGRLREQKQLCQEEIGLGAKWGSRAAANTPGYVATAPVVDAETMRDINAMLEVARSETDLAVSIPAPEPIPASKAPSLEETFRGTSGSEEDLDAFLARIDATSASEPEVRKNDFEDLLENLI